MEPSRVTARGRRPADSICGDAQDAAFVRSAHGSGDDAVETAIRIDQAGYQAQA
jgi:hypothetical protein